MDIMWFIIITLSTSLRIASIILFYLLYQRYKDVFFKFNLLLQLSLHIPNILLTAVLNFNRMAPSEWLMSGWCYMAHFMAVIGVFIRFYWGHKIVGQEVPLKAKISGIIVSLLVLASLAKSIVTNTFDTTLIAPLTSIPVIYSLVIIRKNLNTILHKSNIPFFRVYIVLISIIIFTNLTLNTVDRFVTDFDFSYIISFVNETSNIGIIIMVLRFFTSNYFADSRGEDVLSVSKKIIQQYGLTEWEVKLINLLFDGLTAKEISEVMHVSVQTVKNYRSRLYQKVNVSGKIELIKLFKTGHVSI